MKGLAPDLSAVMYQIFHETHTTGNAARGMIMKKSKQSAVVTVSHTHPNALMGSRLLVHFSRHWTT
ncbi:hypothetical protein EDD16DRAFT_1618821 [Pisolithus croceorrhizus]|nr:hypothetical protein EDD16DRAFT_1618821 [Pisolithus croceorrhizus]